MTKLGTKLAHDPKIKVFALLEFYNFALGYIAMQTFYDIVQPRSNIAHDSKIREMLILVSSK